MAIAVAVASAAQAGGSGSITGRLVASPLSVEVMVPTDPVRAGRQFRIRAEVVNSGSTPLRNVDVSLVRDSAIVLYDPAHQVLNRVAPGRDKRVGWDACSRTPGSYVVLVRAVSSPFTAESAGALVRITDVRRPTC
jgi:hypothetical protein